MISVNLIAELQIVTTENQEQPSHYKLINSL